MEHMEPGASNGGNQNKRLVSNLPEINVQEPRIISPGGSKSKERQSGVAENQNEKSGDVREQPRGEVNMEAYISPEDVIRAGGFGAKDDIGSFLPVASDSTDFEQSIRSAREYEEKQGEVSRPGLGWQKE